MSKQTEFVPPSAEGGATIVKLAHAVKFNGDETDRVTIPALRGKHLARIPYKFGEQPTIGAMVEWANWVVLPTGIVDEMHPADARAVAVEVNAQLGKSLTTGEPPSE